MQVQSASLLWAAVCATSASNRPCKLPRSRGTAQSGATPLLHGPSWTHAAVERWSRAIYLGNIKASCCALPGTCPYICALPCAGLHLGGTHIGGFFAGLEGNVAAKQVIAGLMVLDISEPLSSTVTLARNRTRARTQGAAANQPADMLRIMACLLQIAIGFPRCSCTHWCADCVAAVPAGQKIRPPPQSARHALHTLELVACEDNPQSSAACSSSPQTGGAPGVLTGPQGTCMLALDMRNGSIYRWEWGPGGQLDMGTEEIVRREWYGWG